MSLRLWNYAPRIKGTLSRLCILSLDASRSLFRIDPVSNEHDLYLCRETKDKHDAVYLYGRTRATR